VPSLTPVFLWALPRTTPHFWLFSLRKLPKREMQLFLSVNGAVRTVYAQECDTVATVCGLTQAQARGGDLVRRGPDSGRPPDVPHLLFPATYTDTALPAPHLCSG
jgi:hypothetical protein